MSDLIKYGRLVADNGRTLSFDRALRVKVRPGAVVLDIGTGPGILAFLACRAGAGRVYAVEPDDVIELARQVAADNGFSDRIKFIQAMTTDIDLPEKVDGIVADIRGLNPLFQKSIVSILDARDRFLKPEGWIIPARDTIWAAPASSEIYEDFIGTWNNAYQFDFSRARLRAANNFCGIRLSDRDLVAEPQRWKVLDYKNLDSINADGELRWVMSGAASARGVCLWFDCETAPGMGYSNSPESHAYKQGLLPWPEAIDLIANDRIQVRLRADFVHADYEWSWETRVIRGERVISEFRQSTFSGTPLPPDRLRKRAHRFVPEPNEDFSIDRLALDLMRQKHSLDEIAKALVAEFPARFTNWNAALTRAADLSQRYSK